MHRQTIGLNETHRRAKRMCPVLAWTSEFQLGKKTSIWDQSLNYSAQPRLDYQGTFGEYVKCA